MEVEKIMRDLEQKHPGEKEFLQAVHEVLLSIVDVYNQHPEFENAKIIERMVEPERVVMFRVPWVDDKGEVQVNIGYPVQQRYRPVQRRSPFPRCREARHAEVPRFRADLQERSHHAPDGWR